MPQPHRGNGPFLEFQIFKSWIINRLLHLQVKFPAAHTLRYLFGFWGSAALPLHCQEGNIPDPPCAGCITQWPLGGGQTYPKAPRTGWASEIRDNNNGPAQLSLSQESCCWAQNGAFYGTDAPDPPSPRSFPSHMPFPTAPQPQVGQPPPPPPQPAPSGADFPSPSWLLIYFHIKCEDTDFLPCPEDLFFSFLQEI